MRPTDEPVEAKRLTDKVINLMEGVQNLRKAVYEYVFRSHKLRL